jgi:hypothetical protein
MSNLTRGQKTVLIIIGTIVVLIAGLGIARRVVNSTATSTSTPSAQKCFVVGAGVSVPCSNDPCVLGEKYWHENPDSYNSEVYALYCAQEGGES